MYRKLLYIEVFVCLLGAAATCQAQGQSPAAQTTSSVNGQGTFSGKLNGAGMDGATITLTNSNTSATQTATADQNGNFTFSNLMPGTYRVSVKLRSGLQLAESTLEVNANNQAQLTLAPTVDGTAAGRLELDARSPTLQTDTAEVSRAYDSQTIRSLPILDRQNQELITLMPGVSPPVQATDRINDPQRTRMFNVNGQPAYANLFNQDGAYDNEPFTARPLRVEPDEGVQTLEVRTSNYNAEYGISAGSWASTLTRPGTNAFHGSLFEFNTNNFFRTGRVLNSSLDTPRFNTNQFGITAGGPAIRDKMFWFFSYEGYIQNGSQEAVATVPTSTMAAGNFSGVAGLTLYNPFTGNTSGSVPRSPFANNTIPTALINRTSARILSLIPAPNQPGFTNNLVGSVPLLDDTHRLDGKLDQRFSERMTGFLRYGFTESSVDQGSLLGAVGSPLQSDLRAMNAVGSLTYIFNRNLLTEMRFGYDRYRNPISPFGDFTALNGALSTTGFANGLPSINISGFSALGLPANVPSKQIDNVYDGASNWIAHAGINAVKFGIGARDLEVNGISSPFFSSLGSFTFGPGATLASASSAANLSPAALQANALAGFLTGTPVQSGVSSYPLSPAYRQMQYSAYIVDTVNLFQRLWLEAGVRYDIFSPISPAQNGGALLFNSTNNTTTPVGTNGATSNINRYDLNNIAPRVGLAFRPVDRLVFRAGYGILYFALPMELSAFNPLTQSVQSGVAGAIGTTSFTIPTIPAAGSTAANTPYFVSPRNFQTPYLQTYSAMIQGDLGNGFLLDIGYVGNTGRQLPSIAALAGLPGTGLSGLTPGRTATTFDVSPGLTSNYNSLQVNMTKRFAGGLAITGAYTYSKALDYGMNLLDPFNRANNYGPADWDRTHVLAVSHVWRLPFGVKQKYFTNGWAARAFGDWELNGILRWATGTPYTVTADPLACACLGATSVPASFNPGSGASSFNGSASFNSSEFSSPASGTFGNLSRNAFRGPDFFVYNMALFRNFGITENIKIELRGEVYNLTNTSNPMNPVASFTSPGFGTSLGNVDNIAGRQFQVAARILF